MVAKALKDILTRVESWPERAQEEAAASLLAIEEELREPYQLTDADKEAVDRGLEAVRRLAPVMADTIPARSRRPSCRALLFLPGFRLR